jgi:adenine phosphoribosyltransferase
MITDITIAEIKEEIRNIPDFPKKGIQFKDITTILRQPEYFSFLVDTIADAYKDSQITKIVCLEARGFILGGAIAAKLGAGFVPIRKPGKLPADKYSVKYSLEYGINSLEIHKDALNQNDVVLLHDDLLATGGTATAAIKLLNNFNLKKIYLCFLCELNFLNGRERLKSIDVSSLIHF